MRYPFGSGGKTMSKSEMKRKNALMGRPLDTRASKYWICDTCAKNRGLIGPSWAVTLIKGWCGHCDSSNEQFLTPLPDFNDPKTGKKAILPSSD